MTPARIAELTALANNPSQTSRTAITLVAAIHELLAEVTWTLVTDGLPDADKTVIVNCPSEEDPVQVGEWDGTEWLDEDANAIDVVAWRELPEGIDETAN